MYGKGRVNGELSLQLYCQFLTKRLAAGRDYFEGEEAQSTFNGRHLIGSVRWWLCFSCVQFLFAQVRLISGVFPLSSNPDIFCV